MDAFDYVVIGGGSAGSAAAAKLAEDGTRRVCLLEAGGCRTTPGSIFWTKSSTGCHAWADKGTTSQHSRGTHVGSSP